MKELNIPEKLVPTERVEYTFENLRHNLIIYSSLKKHLDKKMKEKEKVEKYLESHTKQGNMMKSSVIQISQHSSSQYPLMNGILRLFNYIL